MHTFMYTYIMYVCLCMYVHLDIAAGGRDRISPTAELRAATRPRWSTASVGISPGISPDRISATAELRAFHSRRASPSRPSLDGEGHCRPDA